MVFRMQRKREICQREKQKRQKCDVEQQTQHGIKTMSLINPNKNTRAPINQVDWTN